MDTSLEFRKAGPSDVPVLTRLSKQAFDSDVEVGAPSAGGPPGYMSEPFHLEMARTGHLYKLTEKGLIVGGALLFRDGDELNVGRVFVNPAHFRQGYGMRMMEAIEDMFADVKVFTLDTPVWNIRTNAFYTKLGYTEVKRSEDVVYYSKRR
jgi:ribosomal protein S18 acetylase RimI-like enzyme